MVVDRLCASTRSVPFIASFLVVSLPWCHFFSRSFTDSAPRTSLCLLNCSLSSLFFIYNRRRVYSQAQLLSQLPAPHKLKKSHRGNSPLSTTEQVAGFKASSSSTDLPESHSSGNAPPTKLHAQPELLSAKPAFHATSELSVSGAAEEIETA